MNHNSQEKRLRFNHIRVEVVTKYDQLLHAFAVRSICFMEEHGVPALQTYDGNDYQATHVIAYAADEPIATARLRWFRDFVKMERTCFRKEHRGPRILQYCSEFIFDHVAQKGYDKLITHAKPKYARMWKGVLGFEMVPQKEPMYFANDAEPYLELIKHLDPHPRRISEQESVAVLFRVEGQWDKPSSFERTDA
jgi:hypothetical protein